MQIKENSLELSQLFTACSVENTLLNKLHNINGYETILYVSMKKWRNQPKQLSEVAILVHSHELTYSLSKKILRYNGHIMIFM